MRAASTKPYLLRAIFDWCVDHGFTPHLAVVVDDQVLVPPGYARDGQIVLNIGSEATANLDLGNDSITFQARFGGISQHLYIPVSHVLAIYARENGQGMAFELDIGHRDPALGLVGSGSSSDSIGQVEDDGLLDEGSEPGDEDDDPPRPRGGHLKLVK